MTKKLLFWSIITWAVSVFCILMVSVSINIPVANEEEYHEVAVAYNLDFIKVADHDISVLLNTNEVEEVEEVEEPEPYYEVTDYERELLERLVYHEGNTESLECQKAIASVVFNRLYDEYHRFGSSIKEVIYAPGQFTVASYLFEDEPNETNREAVDWVIWNGPSIDEKIQFFRSKYYFSWVEPAMEIDNTYFSYGVF